MHLTLIAIFYFLCFNPIGSPASPFTIDFSAKTDLSEQDYFEVQAKLESLDIKKYLCETYPNIDLDYLSRFFFRATKGTSQVLICPEKQQYPYQKLKKIGQGGDVCIVSCCPFNGVYADLLESTPHALENVGFNGYYFYRIGGFPNPTGEEINFVAVPYSFKVFLMLEAANQGFEQVLWMDASLLPLRDLTPILTEFKRHDCLLINGNIMPALHEHLLLPIARESLIKITSTDPIGSPYVCTMLFGLNMKAEKTQPLIDLFYQCVRKGYPFLTLFPEEIVLTSIIGSFPKEEWSFFKDRLLITAGGKGKTLEEKYENKQKQGYFFYYRNH